MTANPPIVSRQTPLVFVHVPKTGGISLFTSMAAVWGDNIADLYNLSAGDERGLRAVMEQGPYEVYAGHFSYGLHEWIAGQSLYATILREPMARLESLYFFLRRRWAEYKNRLSRQDADGAPLPDFHKDLAGWLQAGSEEAERFFRSPSLELENGMVRRFSGHGQNPQHCTEETLRLAQENLETRFSVVGLTERYADTIQLMSRVFQLPGFKEHHINKSTPKPEEDRNLAPALRKRIEDSNQLDIALYEWARKRFDGHAAAARPVKVPGGIRTDLENAPLWKSVGSDGLRSAIKRHKGSIAQVQEERMRAVQPTPLVSRRLSRVGFKPKEILLEFEAASQNAAQQSVPPVRLALTTANAEFLLTELQKALAAHKKSGGAP